MAAGVSFGCSRRKGSILAAAVVSGTGSAASAAVKDTGSAPAAWVWRNGGVTAVMVRETGRALCSGSRSGVVAQRERVIETCDLCGEQVAGGLNIGASPPVDVVAFEIPECLPAEQRVQTGFRALRYDEALMAAVQSAGDCSTVR